MPSIWDDVGFLQLFFISRQGNPGCAIQHLIQTVPDILCQLPPPLRVLWYWSSWYTHRSMTASDKQEIAQWWCRSFQEGNAEHFLYRILPLQVHTERCGVFLWDKDGYGNQEGALRGEPSVVLGLLDPHQSHVHFGLCRARDLAPLGAAKPTTNPAICRDCVTGLQRIFTEQVKVCYVDSRFVESLYERAIYLRDLASLLLRQSLRFNWWERLPRCFDGGGSPFAVDSCQVCNYSVCLYHQLSEQANSIFAASGKRVYACSKCYIALTSSQSNQ